MSSEKSSPHLKKTKIAFDIDGVICDFTHEFIFRLREHLQEDISYLQTDYNFLDPYIDFFAYQISIGMFFDCFPYPEAQVYLTELLENPKYEVYFITARGTETGIDWTPSMKYRIQTDTINWIKTYFPKFDINNLRFCNRKDETLLKIGAEMMVEDRKDTAEKVSKVVKSFLLTRPWNMEGSLNSETTRIASLKELDFYLKG